MKSKRRAAFAEHMSVEHQHVNRVSGFQKIPHRSSVDGRTDPVSRRTEHVHDDMPDSAVIIDDQNVRLLFQGRIYRGKRALTQVVKCIVELDVEPGPEFTGLILGLEVKVKNIPAVSHRDRFEKNRLYVV